MGCSQSPHNNSESCGHPSGKEDPKDNEAIVAYVEGEKGEALLKDFESGITSTGLTCKSTIKASGTGIILTVCINELDDVSELTYITIQVCDVDGDVVETIHTGE